MLRTAATISYVSLTCHEDTWTFLARRAFGTWSPEWLTSVAQEGSDVPGPRKKTVAFIKNPNLTPGRITKHENGMQTVEVSGDNLVAILERLWDGAYSRNPYKTLMDLDPNRSACGPLHAPISSWLETWNQDQSASPAAPWSSTSGSRLRPDLIPPHHGPRGGERRRPGARHLESCCSTTGGASGVT